MSTRDLIGEKRVSDVFQNFCVSLQGWGDCFAKFQESDGTVKQSFQLVRFH